MDYDSLWRYITDATTRAHIDRPKKDAFFWALTEISVRHRVEVSLVCGPQCRDNFDGFAEVSTIQPFAGVSLTDPTRRVTGYYDFRHPIWGRELRPYRTSTAMRRRNFWHRRSSTLKPSMPKLDEALRSFLPALIALQNEHRVILGGCMCNCQWPGGLLSCLSDGWNVVEIKLLEDEWDAGQLLMAMIVHKTGEGI